MRKFLILLVLPALLMANELDKWTIVVYGSAKVEVEADIATIVYGVPQRALPWRRLLVNLKRSLT